MSLDPREDEFDIWRDKVVLGLAGVAALAAIFSTSTTFPSVNDPLAVSVTRATAAISELFFAVIYLLLGFRPRRYRWIWEITVLHRLALVGVGLLLVVNGAAQALFDVGLNLATLVLLIAAYVFGKGYQTWRHGSEASAG